MTDYEEQTEVQYKDSPYSVCGNVSLKEKDGETIKRSEFEFEGEETFEDITVDELLEIYNETEAE